jgi:hypothetical protein
VKLALMLPAYQGAVLARIQREQQEADPELDANGGYQPPEGEDQHEVSHRIAQAQPVATADQIAALTGRAPGVGMWGEVIKVPSE